MFGWARRLYHDVQAEAFWIGFMSVFDITGITTARRLRELNNKPYRGMTQWHLDEIQRWRDKSC